MGSAEYYVKPGTNRLGGLAGCILVGLCVLAYVAGFGSCLVFWSGRTRTENTRDDPFVVFWEAWRHIEQNFYGPLPSPRERTYGAIREALNTLGDPYTIFIEPTAREREREYLRGSYGDIGVDLWRGQDGALVLYPLPDSPAAHAGVLEGDILVAVGGEVISGTASLDEVRARFRGEVGTAVTLTVSRPPNPPFDVIVVREEVRVPSVTWRVIDIGGIGIGYLRIGAFTENSEGEIATALRNLMQQQVRGFILDLRNNSGGLLDVAVSVASKFLKDGVVLVERGRNGELPIAVRGDEAVIELPMVVLVNRGTASAAEVVAGALQDYERALLVGEPTYGKGSIQSVYDLSDGAALHVTTAIWLTPDHRQINGFGIVPDFYVADESDEDEQLDWAVAWFGSKLGLER